MTPFQIAVLVLSIYSLMAVFVQEVLKPPIAVSKLLDAFDLVVCAVFLIDFTFQMVTSKNRLNYFLKWGWIDLISSIPAIGFTRWGRLVRMVRLLRMLKSFRMLLQYLFKDKASGTLVTAGLTSFLMLIVSSTLILYIETTPQSHIRTSIDAILWAFSAMSSSAIAGDAYPVTPLGKILSIFLLISGMGLFSTFTAFMAGLFIGPSQDIEARDIEEIKEKLRELNDKIEKMK
ncbi:MAG TPA: ion transporter [Chitinivibrionales bacterium]|nr:ion transporter [Chitinivibrionales bacterium]